MAAQSIWQLLGNATAPTQTDSPVAFPFNQVQQVGPSPLQRSLPTTPEFQDSGMDPAVQPQSFAHPDVHPMDRFLAQFPQYNTPQEQPTSTIDDAPWSDATQSTNALQQLESENKKGSESSWQEYNDKIEKLKGLIEQAYSVKADTPERPKVPNAILLATALAALLDRSGGAAKGLLGSFQGQQNQKYEDATQTAEQAAKDERAKLLGLAKIGESDADASAARASQFLKGYNQDVLKAVGFDQKTAASQQKFFESSWKRFFDNIHKGDMQSAHVDATAILGMLHRQPSLLPVSDDVHAQVMDAFSELDKNGDPDAIALKSANLEKVLTQNEILHGNLAFQPQSQKIKQQMADAATAAAGRASTKFNEDEALRPVKDAKVIADAPGGYYDQLKAAEKEEEDAKKEVAAAQKFLEAKTEAQTNLAKAVAVLDKMELAVNSGETPKDDPAYVAQQKKVKSLREAAYVEKYGSRYGEDSPGSGLSKEFPLIGRLPVIKGRKARLDDAQRKLHEIQDRLKVLRKNAPQPQKKGQLPDVRPMSPPPLGGSLKN